MKLKKLGFFLALLATISVAPRFAWPTVSNTTVQTTTGYGNGVTTSFPITFDFRDNSWLRVTQYDTSTNPATVTSISQGVGAGKFTVTGGNPGNTIVMGTAPSATQYEVITRVIPLTQPVVFNPASIFPYGGLSALEDQITLQLQNLNAGLTGSSSSSGSLPSGVGSNLLGWDSSGASVVNYPDSAVAAGDILQFDGATWTSYALNQSNLMQTLNGYPNAPLSAASGGSGVTNAGTLTWGSNPITLTTSGITALTLPTSGTLLAGTADTSNTPNTFVKRDGSGNFSANVVTANSFVGDITGNITGDVTGNISGTAANVTGVVAYGNGGTSQTTRQGAINGLLDTSGSASDTFARYDGANVTLDVLKITDVPQGFSRLKLAQDTANTIVINDAQGNMSVLTGGATGNVPIFNGVAWTVGPQGTGIPGIFPYGADTGVADAYVVATPNPPVLGYTAGIGVSFVAANSNTGTGTATVDVNGLGAANIKHWDGTDLIAGDILAGQVVIVEYDGANFQLIDPAISEVSVNANKGLTALVSNNADYFPSLFASTTNGYQPFNLGSGLKFNPSTNTLTTTNYVGSSITIPGSGATSEQFGAGANASGALSVALGNGALASGPDATALGWGATATGAHSVSVGPAASSTASDTFALGVGANVSHNFSIAIGDSATSTAVSQFIGGSDSAPIRNVYLGNGVTDATPLSTDYHATGGLGSNIAGANLSLDGGISTGSANGGSILFKTSPAGGAGSSANALVTAATIDSSQNLSLTNPLAVTSGGSGLGTLTSHCVVVGAGTANVHFACPSSAGQLLTDNGAGADPTFQAGPTSGINQLTGDVTAGPGTGSQAATIALNAVTNAKLAQMGASTIKGNVTASTADPSDLTGAQVNTILPIFTSTLNGLTPASGGGTTNFLRADGTWATAGAASPLTTKGDLYGYSTLNGRIPVGSNNTVLTADSAQPFGVKWAQTDFANITGIATVPQGGTGDSTFSANQVIIGGTTSTGALQQVAGAALGSVLTSQGTTSAPIWQTINAIGISTDWAAYTPTFTGIGTPTNVSFSYRRVGDSLEVRGTFTTGTVTASLASISFPNSLVMDTAKMSGGSTNVVVGAGAKGATSNNPLIALASPSNSTTAMYFGQIAVAGTNPLAPLNGNSAFSSSENESIYFSVPVTTYSSNTIGAGQGEVVASYIASSATFTPGANNQINFDTKLFDSGCLIGSCLVTTGASWKFTAPVTGSYNVLANVVHSSGTTGSSLIYKNGSAYFYAGTVGNGSGNDLDGPVTSTIQLNAGDYIDLRPNVGATLAGSNTTPYLTRINVSLVSGNGTKDVKSWSGYHSGATWSTTTSNSAGVDFTNSGTAVINQRTSTNFSAVTTAASNLPGITFSLTYPTALYICATMPELYMDTSGDAADVFLIDGNGTEIATNSSWGITTGQATSGTTLCGISSAPAGSQTVKIKGSATGGGTARIAAGSFAKVIEWSVHSL